MMKSFKLVPMSDKQKTTTSTDLGSNGVLFMSQATTCFALETRSKEWTFWGTANAKAPSPQPKSAITASSGLENAKARRN